jgi:glycosyltransferase involved in cell wall biosynthesis
LWPWVARRARRLVAISEYARAEAIELLAVPPERIQALPSGPGFMPPMEGGKAADGDRPYLLYVGALAASKNLPFLVEAYDRTTADVALVLAGKPGDGYAELQAALDGMRRRGDVTILGEVSDERLDSLYRGAVALVHPSLYEGFGFTPLEAMSRGCPVVASDIPALREIAGEGAALVPIERAEDWAAAIERIASDESWRNELRERGRVRVSGYSWDETARGLCRLFVDVLGTGR